MAETKKLLTPREAAERIGVSVTTVKEWMRRAADPLPSMQVGHSGRVHRIVTDEIDAWLLAEAARKPQTTR